MQQEEAWEGRGRGRNQSQLHSGGGGLTTAKDKAWETLRQQRACNESTRTHIWITSIHVAICLDSCVIVIMVSGVVMAGDRGLTREGQIQ